MKSIVLCEPNYGDQKEENRTSNKSKNNGIKRTETRERLVKNDDSLSDIEFTLVIGNAVNGGEKTDMRRDESNKTEKEEESSPYDDRTVGKSVEASFGVGETVKDDEDIEILSCTVERVGSEKRKSLPFCVKDDNLGVKHSNSLSPCHGYLGHEVETNENGVKDLEVTESNATGDWVLGEKPSEGNERGEAEESECDRGGTEVNTGRESSDKNVDQEKAICELNTEETEADSRGKQSSDEGFIEEEENKENRNDEGPTGEDARTQAAWVEAEESFNASWNGKKGNIYGSQENSGQETYLAESEMDVDVIEGGENKESEECSVTEEENALVSASKKEESEKLEDSGKLEENMVQKRKRRSLDGGEVVKSFTKKRRTGSSKSTDKEVKRRHSHDAAFTENDDSQSCQDSGDNEDESNMSKMESDAHKKNALEESIDRVASGATSLPFLESLRGTIKTLSRSDLEELIVQKLCEVITERSTVGFLRKKAQALEQDQERWKDKVQSLTKQLREMDMVMKKYMSEVQKQGKERNFQMVTPLRVTRSVGLQVSFGSSSSKQSKVVTNNNQAIQPVLQTPEKVPKPPAQLAVSISPNTRKNLPVVLSNQGKKTGKEQKKPFTPRPGVNVTFQARLISPQALVAPNGALQTQQMNITNRPRLPGVDQNSKIIDLTEDDDRQNSHIAQKTVLPSSVAVRPPGHIRVVNHIQPTQMNSAGRVAYLVPATTATASGSSVPPQSRQLLIATPTGQPPPRQLLPSVPPLLYKGSTILQPGAQQPAVINQSNRALMPKPLKHPAPLPQPPANQIQKPNLKLLPPRPALKISKVQTGIVLSWNMVLGPEYEPIASYQLYAYQENNSPPTTSLWKKVGDVKALPLPMACTLTQFMSGHKYYFAVRAVDLHSRIGPFSFPGSIVLIK